VVRGDAALVGVATTPVKVPLQLSWSFKAGKPILATPAVDARKVYFGDGEGKFFAVQRAGGVKAWEFVLMDPKKNKPSRDPIEGSACLVAGKVIFGGTDGVVRALDGESGHEAWKYEATGEIKGGVTPFRRNAGGEVTDCVIAVGFTGEVVCLEAASGRKTWDYDAGGPINGAASVSGAGVVFGGCNGTIDVLDPVSGTRRQRIDIKIYMPNSVAVRDGVGYFAHSGNKVEAWDLASPKQLWEYHERDFAYFTSPAVTDEYVFVGGEDKRLHCLRRSNGEEKWAFRARDNINSSPVVAGSFVIAGSDDGRVYAIDLVSGEERWSYEIGAPVKSSPAVVDGSIFVGADDGVLYCFAAEKK
jgi:outer membrane protein assembly factor BamB